ncbi:LANO_0E03950g1_1 [Lachancea nothofagi CBS 11611]|uniref:Aurora kinase n=1 Tax=Lachancea nothofagi CBS 11611 TaxID=1266666 RepID=A0A1G4JS02_9SACH|nr:LANO_0E03950g1_1 [Lachancea nothofagi CBS 11611]
MSENAMAGSEVRRNSLNQRNMLLSMRLNNGLGRKSLGNSARSGIGSNSVRKPWRMNFTQESRTGHLGAGPTVRVKDPGVSSRASSPAKINSRTVQTSPRKDHKELNNRILENSPLKYQELSLDDFEVGKKLGKGKFGKVYCVKHKRTGFICALKAMKKKELVQNNVQKQFRREVEIQAALKHPNLTRLYGYFHDEKRVYLLMEYIVNGELYKHLRSHGPFNDIAASYFVYQIADALDHMHSRHILHRDIKPENILIGFQNTLKLTDFGWSVTNVGNGKRKTLCGTLDYLSPELIKIREYDDKADVWALGVLTFELLVGNPPFEESSKELTYRRILKRDLRFPDHVSMQARDLINKLLEYEPNARITPKDMKKHPWIETNRPFW